jgi:hypothetical protein
LENDMTDRELIELAARAAGIELSWELGGYIAQVDDWSPRFRWNPLTSDADAFRLAVKLGITAHMYTTCVSAKRHRGDGVNAEEDYSQDPYAATRRAITRAAAEIGRGMV